MYLVILSVECRCTATGGFSGGFVHRATAIWDSLLGGFVHRATELCPSNESQIVTRAHASSSCSCASTRSHASSSCCCIHAIAVAHSVGEKVDGSSLCASRGRPRSWITCAIRRHQTSSEVIRGNQRPSEAIRGNQTQSDAIRGHHHRALELVISLESVDNQTHSEVIRGHQRSSPPCPRARYLAQERRQALPAQ